MLVVWAFNKFISLPRAQGDGVQDDIDVYQIAMEKLDAYFAWKQWKLYERHVLRLIKQPNEKFEIFLVRLRAQAAKYAFTNTEENIIEQIVEKCHSSDLRKKFCH